MIADYLRIHASSSTSRIKPSSHANKEHNPDPNTSRSSHTLCNKEGKKKKGVKKWKKCGAYIIKEGESGHCCLHSSPSIKSAVIKDGHVSLDFVFCFLIILIN